MASHIQKGIPVGDYAKLQPLVQVAIHRRIPSAAQPAQITPAPTKPSRTKTGDSDSDDDDPIECTLCRLRCANNDDFMLHLRSHRSHRVPAANMVVEPRHKLLLTLLPGCNAQTHDLRMLNVTAAAVEVRHMFVLHERSNWILQFDAIALRPDEVVTLELEKRFLHPGATSTIVIQTVAGGGEYIEWHALKHCCAHQHMAMRKKPVQRLPCDNALLQLLQRPATFRRRHFAQLHASHYRTIEPHNYCAFFELASQCERIDKQLDLQQYTSHRQKFNLRTTRAEFFLQVPDALMPNGEPCKLTEYDTVRFTPSDGQPVYGDKKYCEAEIVNVSARGLLTVRLMGRKPPSDREFTVSFHIGSYVFDIEVEALQWMAQCQVLPALFPAAQVHPGRMESVVVGKTTATASTFGGWFNADLNELQQLAVQQIVAGTAYPAPYLLFGPPGTGKTKTLCEAIVQLWRQQPNSRILVCATSNAAADELAQRVVDHLPFGCPFAHSLFRLYAASCMRKEPSKDMEKLERHSNAPDFDMPAWTFLRKFRVVVCTLVVAGGLRYGMGVQATDFTHVFIDESGSSTELASLLPIAVCTTAGRINAQIILAGDPKQLGPVIMSEHAACLGYGVSLLERLMRMPLYAKHKGTYNRNVLTKLVNNYRSHPLIVDLVNRPFYDGELRACGDPARTQRFASWWRLPAKRTPIIFHAVSGLTQRELGSTSLHNPVELDVIMYYVMQLLQHGLNGTSSVSELRPQDIGIISPYARQCQLIRDALAARGWSDVMVATVEAFQGRERPVILTSTVRSRRTMPGLGFLGCAKRLNVMITRAESLLIMVGDPQTLMLDPNWCMVLRRCQELRVCVGETFRVPADKCPWRKNQPSGWQHQQHQRAVRQHIASGLPVVAQKIGVFNGNNKQQSLAPPSTENQGGVDSDLDLEEIERYLRTQKYAPCASSVRIQPTAKQVVSKPPKTVKPTKGKKNAPAKIHSPVSQADSAIGSMAASSGGDKSPVSVDDDNVSDAAPPPPQYKVFQPYADPKHRPVCRVCGLKYHTPTNPSDAMDFYSGEVAIEFPGADDDPSGRPLIMRCPSIAAAAATRGPEAREDRDAVEQWMCDAFEQMKVGGAPSVESEE